MQFSVVTALVMGVFAGYFPSEADAANFTMQTGNYVGSGVAGLAISGVGFQADYLMIRSTSAAGVAVFKTSSMPANTIAYTSATANDTTTQITLDSDGFTVGTLAVVNSANVVYNWVAIDGSDCSATGNFCVGTYTGNGAGNRNITVGFQPTMAMVKRTTNVAGHFQVDAQPDNETLFFTNTARDTAGNYIRLFSATAFQVGATDNTNTAVYYYAVFKSTAGSFAQGTYTGDAVDGRNITGAGFVPDFALVKNATSATANDRRPYINFTESYGDNSSHVGVATANAANAIQALQTDGFQVGTDASANGTGATIYWFAFAGAPDRSTSGSFEMTTGSYVGTGASNPKTGLGFMPDLVIVKTSAQVAVFRTKTMQGDSTAHMSGATANFAGGVTSLDADGFTLGTAAQTNSLGVTYQWQAFGNAFDPYDNDGASDFAVGSFYGSGVDSRNITRLPWQPDMVTIKANTTQVGAWKPSSLAGDSTAYFSATANGANVIQSLSADGFQVGNSTQSNGSGVLSHWFAFKEGSNFAVGTYTGTGAAQSRTDAGLRAENVWVKRSTAVAAVHKSVATAAASTSYFTTTADATDRITGFVKGGFRVGGNQTETNTSAATYHYSAWNDPEYGSLTADIVDATNASVASPTFGLNTLAYNFNCAAIDGTLGSASQKLRMSNLTTSPGWSASIAATAGATEVWRNVGDTQRYDFNDTGGSPAGCTDSGDADSIAGQLTIDPTTATLAAETGCTNTDVSLGSSASFNEGSIDSIELVSAGASADPDCIWDVTGVDMSQYVPAEQPIGDYDINLTITIVAN